MIEGHAEGLVKEKKEKFEKRGGKVGEFYLDKGSDRRDPER